MNKKQTQKRVGENIKKQRKFKKMTQANLAEKIGVTKRYIQYIEAGQSCINIWRLIKIASALEIASYQLLL